MSTMPGARTRPRASTRSRAVPTSRPTAAMRPSLTATPPGRAGPPDPSTTTALSITKSCTIDSPAGSAPIVGRGALHLEDVVDVRVEVAGQTADRMQPVQVDPSGGGVVEAVAHVEVDDLADHEVGRRVPDRDDPDEPTLHVDRRVGHPRRFDLRARRRRQPGQGELVHLRRVVAR